MSDEGIATYNTYKVHHTEYKCGSRKVDIECPVNVCAADLRDIIKTFEAMLIERERYEEQHKEWVKRR